MLSLTSLLNPAPPGPLASRHRQSPLLSASPTPSYSDERSAILERHLLAKRKMTTKDASGFSKSKAKGTVNFWPFESVDEVAMQEIRKFQIFPFGDIQEFSKHIPYNSGKKDFFEKTGRESFEVFQYLFKLPADDSEYIVMWDYNIGLVRMTPFFKCCRYSKTTPAKMLNMNPGLRDITHSITGGSIMAQGYWMPFSCAKAICATFCHHIAGALIPIFGPQFPSECIHPDAADHGRMIIDPAIVEASTREAERFRRIYASANGHSQHNHHHHHHPPFSYQPSHDPRHQNHQGSRHFGGGGGSGSSSNNSNSSSAGSSMLTSPRIQRRTIRLPCRDDYSYDRGSGGRMRFRKSLVADGSPYGTDTDGDGYSGPEFSISSGGKYMFAGMPPLRSAPNAGWTSAGGGAYHRYRDEEGGGSGAASSYRGANPWLSAMPRFPGPSPPPIAPPPSLPSSNGYSPDVTPRQHHPYPLPPPLSSPARSSPTHNHHGDPHQRRPWHSATKRSAEHLADPDGDYDAGESQSGSSPATTSKGDDAESGVAAAAAAAIASAGGGGGASATSTISSGVEKSAALLLMNLSVRDRDRDGPDGGSSSPGHADEHRNKRRRATSM